MHSHNSVLVGKLLDTKYKLRIFVDIASKFSKTPPPSPVDLNLKDKVKAEEGTGDRLSGLTLRGI